MKFLLLLVLTFSHFQLLASEIDHSRFEKLPPKARKLVLAIVDDFPSLKPSIGYDVPDDFSRVETHKKIPASLEKVWNAYIQISPSTVWSGPLVNFAMAYDRNTQTVYYPDDQAPYFKEGLMVMNYLNLLGHYVVVGLEVTKVDVQTHTVELTYLEGFASKGKQVLKFKQHKNKTYISHTSFYKSDSKFRDKILYPIFHTLTTNEHHRKLRRIILHPTNKRNLSKFITRSFKVTSRIKHPIYIVNTSRIF